MKTIELTRTGGVARVTLNRPDQHNAFNPTMVAELTGAFRDLAADDELRVVVLAGSGASFCAGADLRFMRAAADYSFAENVADGEAIFDLMDAVESCPRPVIGRIHGAAIGGGAGLVSCCDDVLALERARFAFAEVRLGIVPAVISPFVIARLRPGAARRLFLSGERLSAAAARDVGLVDEVYPDEEALDEAVARRVALYLEGAPGAQAEAKALIRLVLRAGAADEGRAALRAATSQLIARRRASEEGRAGMSAFLQKQPPPWKEQDRNDV